MRQSQSLHRLEFADSNSGLLSTGLGFVTGAGGGAAGVAGIGAEMGDEIDGTGGAAFTGTGWGATATGGALAMGVSKSGGATSGL